MKINTVNIFFHGMSYSVKTLPGYRIGDGGKELRYCISIRSTLCLGKKKPGFFAAVKGLLAVELPDKGKESKKG
jgi:hypothetical protein